ncbi:hypothetical protein MCOR27_006358 [Pyricularia oryzae]|uniref:Uncharacterized protein n=2 Tax=Pyricularia TaxID=48558 RepID=A0ABQ8NPC7_PYRGI|nr:hypothetical protein MCOR01_010631 [Pyricularia oryzae]KAI6299598.1 hypothetical protein MCOR33_004506 [Pyricularia grisea]KAH9438357.1 hypothetical protein MCOR02_001991 [Pyricularia oryzae]KAI6254768.1 hypothetical protein MCOR19_008732 [Pyricularia oryzae]KAI6269452.1 hypothetical protein MCOR26_008731 [Pyricularia oryzae]
MLSPRTKRQLRKQIFPPRPPTRTRSKNASVRRESIKNNNNNSDGNKTNNKTTQSKPQPDKTATEAVPAAPAGVDIDIRHIPHLISSAWADPNPTPFLSHFAPDLVYVDHGAQLRILSSGSPLRRHHRDRWGSKGSHRDDSDAAADDTSSGGGGSDSGYDGVLVACEVDPDHEVWWRDIDLEAGCGRCRYRTLNRGWRIGGEDEVEGGGGGGKQHQQQRRGDSWQFSGVVDLVIERGKIARFEEWRRLPVEDGAGGGLAPSEYKVLT